MCDGGTAEPGPNDRAVVGPCLRVDRTGSTTFLTEMLDGAILFYRPLPAASTDLAALASVRPVTDTAESPWNSVKNVLPGGSSTATAYGPSLKLPVAGSLGNVEATFNGSVCPLEFGAREYTAILAARGYTGDGGRPAGNAAVFGGWDPTTRAWGLYAQVFGRRVEGKMWFLLLLFRYTCRQRHRW